jgi:hypothetical protein
MIGPLGRETLGRDVSNMSSGAAGQRPRQHAHRCWSEAARAILCSCRRRPSRWAGTDTTRARAFGLWRAPVPARSSSWWVGRLGSSFAASRPGWGGDSELKERGAQLLVPRRRFRLAALLTDALALAQGTRALVRTATKGMSVQAKRRTGLLPSCRGAGRTEPAHHLAGFLSYRARTVRFASRAWCRYATAERTCAFVK